MSDIYELIIIGGGPAGITAGIYSLRKRVKTLIISKDFRGQVANTGLIENWPGEESISGVELMEKFHSHLLSYNPKIKEEEVKEIKKDDYFSVITSESEYRAKSVIIATGRKPRKLGVPGEEKYSGKGVSYCATCDGPLFSNKKVAVIGGGNAGLETALELSQYALKVTLLEKGEEVSGDEILLDRVNKKGVEVIKKAKVKEFKGEDFLKSLTYLKEGKEEEIEVEGAFITIGSIPITGFLKDLVDYNKRGEIEIDLYTCETKTKGLFAGGDVSSKRDKQIVTATGDGCIMALSAYNHLRK